MRQCCGHLYLATYGLVKEQQLLGEHEQGMSLCVTPLARYNGHVLYKICEFRSGNAIAINSWWTLRTRNMKVTNKSGKYGCKQPFDDGSYFP
jgi:hypothetical protein